MHVVKNHRNDTIAKILKFSQFKKVSEIHDIWKKWSNVKTFEMQYQRFNRHSFIAGKLQGIPGNPVQRVSSKCTFFVLWLFAVFKGYLGFMVEHNSRCTRRQRVFSRIVSEHILRCAPPWHRVILARLQTRTRLKILKDSITAEIEFLTFPYSKKQNWYFDFLVLT